MQACELTLSLTEVGLTQGQGGEDICPQSHCSLQDLDHAPSTMPGSFSLEQGTDGERYRGP